MRWKALPHLGWIVGLGCASILLSSLCGCSWNDVFPPQLSTLENSDAVDRALRLCSLTEGDRPFHLVLEIGEGPLPETKPVVYSPYSRWRTAAAPPALSVPALSVPALTPPTVADMRARVEIYWLNAITYRVVIHSRDFDQIRIVNGPVTEEHNTGDFYPRWIQNFVDAILAPVPQVDKLRMIPGSVPVGLKSHACISNSATGDGQPLNQLDETSVAQVCFQNAEPRIASGVEFTRSVWFDDFAPFGGQQIARTLVNNLPANLLVRGQVSVLEPLSPDYYPLLKAQEFTAPELLIDTKLVERGVAQAMLDTSATPAPRRMYGSPDSAQGSSVMKPVSYQSAGADSGSIGSGAPDSGNGANGVSGGHVSALVKNPMTVYVRTDKTGKVREAYRNTIDQFGLTDAQVARAMKLKFKPLIVNGVPQQMEAPILMPK